jgi:hypothetical protein
MVVTHPQTKSPAYFAVGALGELAFSQPFYDLLKLSLCGLAF